LQYIALQKLDFDKAAVARSVAPNRGERDAMQKQLEALLARAVEAGDAAGAVAAVVDRDGIVAEAAAGMRAAGGTAPMTLDTVLWIASMTKAVTGTPAMQLVEQGRLSLDAPAADLAPELRRVNLAYKIAEAGNIK